MVKILDFRIEKIQALGITIFIPQKSGEWGVSLLFRLPPTFFSFLFLMKEAAWRSGKDAGFQDRGDPGSGN